MTYNGVLQVCEVSVRDSLLFQLLILFLIFVFFWCNLGLANLHCPHWVGSVVRGGGLVMNAAVDCL